MKGPVLAIVLIGLGVAVRVALQNTLPASVIDTLKGRPELVSVPNDDKRVKEILWLEERGIEGSESDLAISYPLHRVLPDPSLLFSPFFYPILDAVSAAAFAVTLRATDTEGSPTFFLALFIFNPLSIAACLAMSASVAISAVMMVVVAAARVTPPSVFTSVLAGASLGLVSYLNSGLSLLLPAVIMMGRKESGRLSLAFAVTTLISFLVSFAFYLYSEVAQFKEVDFTAGAEEVLNKVVPTLIDWFTRGLVTRDSSPNLGAQWYLFVQVFDQFRVYFVAIVVLVPVIGGVVLSLRLTAWPLLAFAIAHVYILLFSPYPSLPDFIVPVSLLFLHSEHVKHMRLSLLVLGGQIIGLSLAPLLMHEWVVTGAGNANFYYALSLVHMLSFGILMLEVGSTSVRLRERKLKND